MTKRVIYIEGRNAKNQIFKTVSTRTVAEVMKRMPAGYKVEKITYQAGKPE